MSKAHVTRSVRESRIVVVLILASLLGTMAVSWNFSSSLEARRVVAAETFPVGSLVEVIDPQLYLRSAPGFSSTVLAHMALNTRGTVLAGPEWANTMTWYQISTSAYGTGWASGTYLSLVSSPASTPTPSGFAAGSTVEVIDNSLDLRAAPGFSSTVLALMAIGTQGTMLQGPSYANGSPWYQIHTGEHGTGWASGSYLRVPGTSPLLTPPTDGLSRLITNGVSGREEIALTIDAGADRGWAKEMLDVLKDNGVHVTFGMTGAWAAENPDLVERMVEEGHQLINHTWSHPSFTGVSASPALTDVSARQSELTRTADAVHELTGYRMSPYWRPPFGDIDASVRKDMYDAGYWQTVMWTIDSMGWNDASVSQILDTCGYAAKAGDIILMHVGYSSNDYASLQHLIDILEEKGLTPVTVEQLIR